MESFDRAGLRAMWAGGRALDAGRLLFESVPPAERPAWAAGLLTLCRPLAPRAAPVEAVLAIAAAPARWSEAHAAFDAVRALTLREERAVPSGRSLVLGLLYLAENAAKVAYNASGPPDPFDADAGWWLARNLRDVVERVGEPAFEERAWGALAGHPDPVT